MKLKFITKETIVFEYIILNDNTINLFISDLVNTDLKILYNDPVYSNKPIFNSQDEYNIIKRLVVSQSKTIALLNIKHDNNHIKLISNAILKDMVV
jgi:hypothetical protein